MNWDDRITDDVTTALDLILAVKEQRNIDDIRTQTDQFSNKINKYPKDKKEKIKIGVKGYIRFGEMLGLDMYGYYYNYTQDSMFTMSSKTKALYDSLNNFYHIESMSSVQSVMDSMSNLIKKDTSLLEMYRQRTANNNRMDVTIYGDPYYRIFKEKLVL